MRPADVNKNNGSTSTNFSCFNSRHFKTSTFTDEVFCFFLRTLFFRFFKPSLAISNLAYSFFAKNRQKTKKLNFLTHVAFFKSMLAIPKQSTFIFASTKAKINKLCCSPKIIGVLCTFFARGLFAPKSAPQAYGTFYFYNDT